MPNPTCIVDGCVKPSRSTAKTYCPMHYHRLYRNGSLEAKKSWHRRGICTIADCGDKEIADGLCSKHDARKRRNGHTDYVGVRPRYREKNPSWSGDNATYGAVHTRLAKWRGPARNHLCIDCGQTAEHWSYDHADFNERTSDAGPYSTDVQHYDPRCVPCHKLFDLSYLAAVG